MCNTKLLGRKYTMVIGALITMAFFFAYTAVKTSTQDTTFTCLIACFLNIYYATLYAYTPEVLPSAHRGTGNGIAVACNRIMGIVSALVATFADTSTSAPLYVCAAIFIAAAIVAALFPFGALRSQELVVAARLWAVRPEFHGHDCTGRGSPRVKTQEAVFVGKCTCSDTPGEARGKACIHVLWNRTRQSLKTY